MVNFVHFLIEEMAKEKEEWVQLTEELRSTQVPKFKDLYEWTHRVLAEIIPLSPQRRTGQKSPPGGRYPTLSQAKDGQVEDPPTMAKVK